MVSFALINKDNKVSNIVEWDGSPYWTPPEGHIAVQNDEAKIGDDYDGKQFIGPPRPPKGIKIDPMRELLIQKGIVTDEEIKAMGNVK